MKYNAHNHSFVICAYGESPYLEECIISLKKQTIHTNIIMTTSTPNNYIKDIAERYQIQLYENPVKGGIASDWNYAYHMASTELVTLAHQDDVYCEQYAENIIRKANVLKKPLIVFSDYSELRNGGIKSNSQLLSIKRTMLLPLRINILSSSIFIRRRILSFGSAICCPSVTFIKQNLPEKIFHIGMKSNIDWEAWEILSKIKGDFGYIPQKLMLHRIHEESTTTAIINEGNRVQEDMIMFQKFWPVPIAKMIEKIYSHGEKSNKL